MLFLLVISNIARSFLSFEERPGKTIPLALPVRSIPVQWEIGSKRNYFDKPKAEDIKLWFVVFKSNAVFDYFLNPISYQ